MKTDIDTQLNYFFLNRSKLSSLEWKRFYSLLHQVLLKINPYLFDKLPLTKKEYIHDFICDKIIFNKTLNKIHLNALLLFFKNYLLSIRRKEETINKTYFNYAIELSLKENVIIEAINNIDLLIDYGITEKKLKNNILFFFNSNENWVYLFLKKNALSDKKTPLHLLAKKNNIPSWDYKSKKLGLGKIVNYKKKKIIYKDTLLGQFFSSFNIKIDIKNKEIILLLFQILSIEIENFSSPLE